MSEVATVGSALDAPRPRPGPGTDDAGERGSLHVADRVVEKIAARAVADVVATTDLDPRLSERLPGRRTRTADADAVISGRLVQLRVRVALEYPTSIVTVTRQVRSHVRETVSRLCDVEVRDVDVVVTRLRRTHHTQGRAR